jgi:hypothetical protein
MLILSACSGTQNKCENKTFSGITVETCYKNNLKNGTEKTYGEKGQLINKSEWKNCKQDGQEIEYFDNGNISRIRTFVNGEIRGEDKQFYKNGNLMFEGYRIDNCALKYGTCYTDGGTAVPLEKQDLDKGCYNHLCLDAIKKFSDNKN